MKALLKHEFIGEVNHEEVSLAAWIDRTSIAVPIGRWHGLRPRHDLLGPAAVIVSVEVVRVSFQEASEANSARRVFVSYIDKSREFYGAQGFTNPYKWAYNREIPFAPLVKPLSECRLASVTTSTPWEGQETIDLVDRPPKRAYAQACDPLPDRMFTMDLSWDKEATHTDDVGSFLPIERLRESVSAGRVGSLSQRFYGVPTEYSQRKTNTIDAPDIVRFCHEDGVDAVLLVGL